MLPPAGTPLRAPAALAGGYGAVLLDLDGTLVDSGAAIDRSWRAWCRRYEVAPTELDGLLHGRTATDVITAVRPGWAPELVAEAAGHQLRYQERDQAPGTALPGAAALLATLAAGHRWAVVTACTDRLARHRLARAGLPVPPLLVSCEQVTRGKPDPEPYLVAARELGLSPDRCLVVEDAPAGVRSAREAGCTVVAVTSTHCGADLAGAHTVVDGLAELVLADPVRSGG